MLVGLSSGFSSAVFSGLVYGVSLVIDFDCGRCRKDHIKKPRTSFGNQILEGGVPLLHQYSRRSMLRQSIHCSHLIGPFLCHQNHRATSHSQLLRRLTRAGVLPPDGSTGSPTRVRFFIPASHLAADRQDPVQARDLVPQNPYGYPAPPPFRKSHLRDPCSFT